MPNTATASLTCLMVGSFRRNEMNLLQKYLILLICVSVCMGVASLVSAAGFPKGTFTLTSSGKSVWTLDFNGKGNFVVTEDGKTVVEGIYKISKEQIQFTDEKGPYAQPEAKIGTYIWKFNDRKLTFTKVEDSAEPRSRTLRSGSWEMKK